MIKAIRLQIRVSITDGMMEDGNPDTFRSNYPNGFSIERDLTLAPRDFMQMCGLVGRFESLADEIRRSEQKP